MDEQELNLEELVMKVTTMVVRRNNAGKIIHENGFISFACDSIRPHVHKYHVNKLNDISCPSCSLRPLIARRVRQSIENILDKPLTLMLPAYHGSKIIFLNDELQLILILRKSNESTTDVFPNYKHSLYIPIIGDYGKTLPFTSIVNNFIKEATHCGLIVNKMTNNDRQNTFVRDPFPHKSSLAKHDFLIALNKPLSNNVVPFTNKNPQNQPYHNIVDSISITTIPSHSSSGKISEHETVSNANQANHGGSRAASINSEGVSMRATTLAPLGTLVTTKNPLKIQDSINVPLEHTPGDTESAMYIPSNYNVSNPLFAKKNIMLPVILQKPRRTIQKAILSTTPSIPTIGAYNSEL